MQDFEHASKMTQSANQATRHEAERYLKSIRSIEHLGLLKQVLETSRESLAQFHAVVGLKELLMHQKYELTHYLVTFVVERYSILQHHVRGILLQTIAISSKLGWNNPQDSTKQEIISFIEQVMHGDAEKQKLGLSLLISLLTEFQSSKASSLGLGLDFHQSCQVAFQKNYLITLFQYCLQAIHDSKNVNDKEYLGMAIRATELVLSWDFSTNATLLLKNKDEVYLDKKTSLNLPPEWGVVLQVPEVVKLFFSLAHQHANDAGLTARLTTCLTQLAHVTGPVFRQPDLKAAYFLNYIGCFQEYVGAFMTAMNPETLVDLGDKIFAIASIGKSLLKLPLDIITASPVMPILLQNLAEITLNCLRHKSNDLEDSWFMDASDELLFMWSICVGEFSQYSEKELQEMMRQESISNIILLISNISAEIVSAYIESKVLCPPTDDDDEFDEYEKDVEMFEDQLINISMLARLKPIVTIQKLMVVLEEKHRQLISLINSNTQNMGPAMVLQEQIHWGVLIAGHILADSGVGETPEIPPSVRQLSLQTPAGQDLVISLPTKIFEILDSLTFSGQSSQHLFCSPLLIETLFWFVDRWNSSYLLTATSNYCPSSPNIEHSFGTTGNGPQVLEFILTKIFDQVRIWQNESDIVNQIIVVLQGLSKNSRARDGMIASIKFSEIVHYFLTNIHHFPASSHSKIVQTIAYIATHCTDPAARVAYFKRLSDTIETSLNTIVQDQNFARTFQMTATRESIIVVLEMFGGLALVVDETTTVAIFETCARHFPTFVKLLDVYHSFPDLELYILQIFRDLVKNQFFDALLLEHQRILYETVYSLIQIYAKNEVGRHRSAQNSEEDELFEDLSVLLELLSSLISSEYEGYERATVLERVQKAKFEIDVSKVVFAGVNSLLPLITREMLSFPRLCLDYIQLVSLLIEYFPDRLYTLPTPLLTSLVQSLLFGTQQSLGRIPDYSYKAIQGLALFVWGQSQSNPTEANYLSNALDMLLNETMSSLLMKPLDTGILQDAADCVFALSMARPSTIQTIMNTFAQQSQNALVVDAVSKLLQVMFDQHQKQREKLVAGQFQIGWGSPHLERFPSLNPYRKMFHSFIIESRNIVFKK